MIKQVNEAEFQNENVGLVLVDFYADWCGPCKMLGPVLEDLSNKLLHVKFLKVNTDNNIKLASSFGIQSIPTLLLFKDGTIVDRKVGFVAKDTLTKWLETYK